MEGIQLRMKDDQGQNHYAVEAFPSPAPEAEDAGGEASVIRLMARYDLNHAVCLEMIDEVMSAFGGQSAADCEADGNPLKELNSFHRCAWKFLIEYQSNQKTADEVRMSTRTMALELGFIRAAGAEKVSELARKTNFDKQTVNKCALNFQRLMGLQRRAGQRGDAARANMAKARIEQIKPNEKADLPPTGARQPRSGTEGAIGGWASGAWLDGEK